MQNIEQELRFYNLTTKQLSLKVWQTDNIIKNQSQRSLFCISLALDEVIVVSDWFFFV